MEIDADVLYSPAYWVLTIGAEIAVLIGFKGTQLWGAGEVGLSIPVKIGIVLAIPFLAYAVAWKFQE